jgi:hypothetical protein
MKYVLQDPITLWLVEKYIALHVTQRLGALFATSHNYGEFKCSPYP